MAMTYLEKMKQNQQQQNQQGLRGVSQQTQQQLQNYQQPYQQTQQAQQAQTNLQQVQAQKPQSYTSKYSGALENILQQIQNPGGFKYDFNGDSLFQYYKDLYTQNAKQGALDAAGIAAGLTGGYGNTYASAAANQAYQQNLLPLYDKGIEFMNAAYNRYAADRADRYDQLGALQNAENAAFKEIGIYDFCIVADKVDIDIFSHFAYEQFFNACTRQRGDGVKFGYEKDVLACFVEFDAVNPGQGNTVGEIS